MSLSRVTLLGTICARLIEPIDGLPEFLKARIGLDQSGPAFGALDAVEVGGQAQAPPSHLQEILLQRLTGISHKGLIVPQGDSVGATASGVLRTPHIDFTKTQTFLLILEKRADYYALVLRRSREGVRGRKSPAAPISNIASAMGATAWHHP